MLVNASPSREMMESIVLQLEAVKAENKRQSVQLKVIITLFVILASVVLLGFSAERTDSLQLKSFSVVDDNGVVRYRLGAIENDYGAVFYDADGKKRIFQGLFADGSARIRMFDERETPRLSSGVFRTDNKEAAALAATTYYTKDGKAKMTLGANSPASNSTETNDVFITVLGSDGKAKIYLADRQDRAQISMRSHGDVYNLSLLVDPSYSGLWLRDGNGKVRTELMSQNDYTRLALLDSNEKIVSNYYASASKSVLAHYNTSGYAQIAMAARSDGGSAFENFDSAGSHTVLMGMANDGSVLNYARKTPGQEMDQLISWGSTAYGILQALSGDKK